MRHAERHRTTRIGWLRAAVLGANDGIVSTASLVVGIAATGAPRGAVLLAGASGLVAGAMSMAAGEYVSVSSQADTERADVAREIRELAADPVGEHAELARIYEARGLDAALAAQVATQLMAGDALGAHRRDELGITDELGARPLQAAAASAAAFTIGAVLPLGVAALPLGAARPWVVAGAAVACLGALGVVGARLGGAAVLRPTARIVGWGVLAMAATALIGRLVGVAV
jgi:VIT1/CCC1 family predicted Fe2+/Mn2+ transporter